MGETFGFDFSCRNRLIFQGPRAECRFTLEPFGTPVEGYCVSKYWKFGVIFKISPQALLAKIALLAYSWWILRYERFEAASMGINL